ncbi:hypothetical protein BDV38DRAFT_290295 [Aspergillus pseudotamarii]|uniref:Altered inheritance of mitochondria protein 9, mitochondrial n=1 Tax=Aspergillus pseudotamarii TaxID=132259 RepID=A0A5N6T2W7_ASPPS|nr:uncharacterized protein BDV38DRAFT_290295 [Aspergillus pseudotamarii]KAE8140648.1 hypothetical protein BDV38DRAFT_290295 [Aspergillus pseudotamarii]
MSVLGQKVFHRFVGSTNTHEPNATRNNLFYYTSGRWLYDEHSQLSRRYIEFNIQALQRHASQVLRARCIGITKLPEGLYNRVLSLEMEGGGELRNVLDIPVPNALAWSLPLPELNSVGTEYVLMERVNGRQLSDNLVEIEKKFVNTIFTGYGRTAKKYLAAVVRREISLLQNSATHKPKDVPAAVRRLKGTINNHIRLLEKFVMVLPHILPTGELTRPVLMHRDLHLDTIFIDPADPTKISSIIDWQAIPLFFDCDDPYPWGAIQPQLPDEFDTLSPTEKELAREAHDRLRLKKFYELASRKFNPLLIRAMDSMKSDDDPTSYFFYLVGQSSSDGPVTLRELLVQIYENWDQIAKKQGLRMQCPISFTEEEIRNGRRQGEEWAIAFNEFENLRAQLLGKEGWVFSEEYDEAMQIYHSIEVDGTT